MGLPRVSAFTDTYLPTVNGVTYTVKTWRDRWVDRGGTMPVVYPRADGHVPESEEYPVRSLPFPFYEGFRMGLPSVPGSVADTEVIHAHTPFGVGVGGLRLARSLDAPLVASYHTPTGEYAEYIALNGAIENAIRRGATAYERWYFDHADVIVTPSERACEHVESNVGVSTPVEVVPNGVDTDFFRPVDTTDFRDRYDLQAGPIVGYTGRHGYEKHLDLLLDAVDGLDVTVVFGGDGPAKPALERRAETVDADVRFLGFLDREDLPAFYATLDAFAFPSPVETQGLVALEANACGTPVAAIDSGALADTVDNGLTGYKAAVDAERPIENGHDSTPAGSDLVDAFRDAIVRTLDERDHLRETCLQRRERMSVSHAVDLLVDVYEGVL